MLACVTESAKLSAKDSIHLKKSANQHEVDVNEYLDALIGVGSQYARDTNSMPAKAMKSPTKLKFSASKINKPDKITL